MTRRGKLAAAAGAVVVAAAAAGTAVFVSGRSAAGPATVPVPGRSGFPSPPVGGVVFSRELGPDALALAALPQSGEVLLQASLVGPQGAGVSGRAISFSLGGTSRTATPCGAGCYRATLAASARRPSVVDVAVGGSPAARWRVALPSPWPPPDGGAVVLRAGRVWRSLRSLRFHERLASDSRHAVRSTWWVQAPDRLAYQVRNGTAGVVVGSRRWDRDSASSRWVASTQAPVTQPSPFWVSIADAHVLGAVTVRGRPAWRISFFDPSTPAWFTATIERRTYRTLELRMITASHFMHDVYGSFNSAPPVRPPR